MEVINVDLWYRALLSMSHATQAALGQSVHVALVDVEVREDDAKISKLGFGSAAKLASSCAIYLHGK